MRSIIFSSCRQFSIVCIAACQSVPLSYISEALRQTYLQGSLSLRYTTYYKAVCLINDLTNTLETNLEKLIGPQAVMKFPAVYVTPRFITLFTTACHVTLS